MPAGRPDGGEGRLGPLRGGCRRLRGAAAAAVAGGFRPLACQRCAPRGPRMGMGAAGAVVPSAAGRQYLARGNRPVLRQWPRRRGRPCFCGGLQNWRAAPRDRPPVVLEAPLASALLCLRGAPPRFFRGVLRLRAGRAGRCRLSRPAPGCALPVPAPRYLTPHWA